MLVCRCGWCSCSLCVCSYSYVPCSHTRVLRSKTSHTVLSVLAVAVVLLVGGWVGGWVGVTRHSFRYDHGGFGGNSVPTTLQGHGRPRPALELNQAPSPLARPWRFGDLSRDPARDPNRTRGLSPSHRQSATSPTSPLNQPARKKSTLATPEGQFQTSVLAALAGIRAELKTLRTDVNDLMQIR